MCYDYILAHTFVCVNGFLWRHNYDFFRTACTTEKRENITQKQLANELNLSEVGIQNYEGERRKPAYDVLIALADYFDVSLTTSWGARMNRNDVKYFCAFTPSP